MLFVFIGNKERGNQLLNILTSYSTKNNNISLCLCFNDKKLMKSFMILINKIFSSYCIFLSNNFGNDIMPTLLMYEKIKKMKTFSKIIKLHTKGDNLWFTVTTSFLLNKSHSILYNLFKENQTKSNCLTDPRFMFIYDTSYNKITYNKYNHYLNKQYFAAGSVFYCERSTFDKVVDFIKNNDFKQFFLNNMYDPNWINIDNSPIHFIERLFGMI